MENMKNNIVHAVMNLTNLPMVYGCAVLMTLLVIGYRYRWISVPRPVALLSWLAVVGIAVGLPLYYLLYILDSDAAGDNFFSIVQMLSFLPVYLCALVLLFFYPKKQGINAR